MAEKDIDQPDATWLNRKFGKYSDQDTLGLVKKSVKDTCEGAPTVFVTMVAATAMIGGAVGAISDSGSQMQYPDQDLAIGYSDSETGYEYIRYDDSKPGIVLVRSDDDTVRMYEARTDQNGVFQLSFIDDAEQAALISLQIQEVLEARSANLSPDAESVAGGDSLDNIRIGHFGGLTEAWANEDGAILRASVGPVTTIDTPIQQAAGEYAAEAAEWDKVQDSILSGAYAEAASITLTDTDVAQVNTSHQNEVIMGTALKGGLIGIMLFSGLFGSCFASHYGKNKRNGSFRRPSTRRR